jgi:hypothetical protein
MWSRCASTVAVRSGHDDRSGVQTKRDPFSFVPFLIEPAGVKTVPCPGFSAGGLKRAFASALDVGQVPATEFDALEHPVRRVGILLSFADFDAADKPTFGHVGYRLRDEALGEVAPPARFSRIQGDSKPSLNSSSPMIVTLALPESATDTPRDTPLAAASRTSTAPTLPVTVAR